MLEISKKRFVQMIDELEKLNNECYKIEQIMGITDNWYGSIIFHKYIHAIELALYGEDCEHQDYRHISDFSYFIYELEYGAKWNPGIDERDIDLSTAAKLYDWLVEDGRIKPYICNKKEIENDS